MKQDYTIYLDSYGYMIYVEENEEIGDYALVLQTANKSDFVGKKAELLFTDGTTKVVTTEKNYSATGSDYIADNTIVTFKVDADGVYTLRAVDSAKASYKDNSAALDLKNDKAGIKVDAGTVNANSATVFVVRDTDDTDDYTAYTGIKNAPTISTLGATTTATKAGVYYYCKTGKMVTVMFIIPGKDVNVEDESSNALFIAVDSVDNLVHDNDGDYYVYNAVVNGELKTVKIDQNVKIVDTDKGTTETLTSAKAKEVDGLFKGYSQDKYGIITTLRTYPAYKDSSDAKSVVTGSGIDKTSKEYTVSIGLTGTDSKGKNVYANTLTMDDNAKVYYADEDGNLSESSYGAIAVDDNDRVYAMVQDYLVKTLVICEVPSGKNPSTPTSYQFGVADASVSVKQGTNNATLTINYEKADFVPTTAALTISYDLYIDGVKIGATRTTTASAAQNSVSVRETGLALDTNEVVTAKITSVTTDKVNLIVKGADVDSTFNGAINVADGKTTGFALDSKYDTTGTYTADDNGTTKKSGNVSALVSDLNTTGLGALSGKSAVTVTVTGIGTKPVTYTLTNSTTAAGIAIAGETTAKVNVAITGAGTATAPNTELTGTIKLTAAPAATDVVAYRVVCSKLGFDEVVTASSANNVKFRINSNVEIKDADFVVTAVKALEVKSSEHDAAIITITFNKEVDKATVDAKSIAYSNAGSGTATALTYTVSGNVVTITAGSGNFLANDTVTVKTAVKGTDGSFAAADVTVTLA